MSQTPPILPFDGSGGGGNVPPSQHAGATAGEVATAIHEAVALALLQSEVEKIKVDLYDPEKGAFRQALKDIDELKHGRTAIYAAIGVVSFLAGIATVVAAFLALKP